MDYAEGGGLLSGLRVIEFASFVAGPSAGLAMAQLGADVIRVDPLGGNVDVRRWPLAGNGASLYWSSLNRGKRSVALDVRSDAGRELLLRLATAPGPDAGIVVDNAVGRGWLSHGELAARRADVISVKITGTSSGAGGTLRQAQGAGAAQGAERTLRQAQGAGAAQRAEGAQGAGGAAVDYTVNAASGVASLTGPADSGAPVNHVVPAWDLLCGQQAVTATLAALRRRDRTGRGAQIEIALADVATAAVANLGWYSEAAERGERERHGNHLYGAFGVDFAAADGGRVMVVVLTPRQWAALGNATGTTESLAALANSSGTDLSTDEGRYAQRHAIEAILAPWFAGRSSSDVRAALDDAGVLWGPYRSTVEVAADFAERPESLPVLTALAQPGIGEVISASSPVRVGGAYSGAVPAHALGADTDAVLAEVLGLTDDELADLRRSGVVGAAR